MKTTLTDEVVFICGVMGGRKWDWGLQMKQKARFGGQSH